MGCISDFAKENRQAVDQAGSVVFSCEGRAGSCYIKLNHFVDKCPVQVTIMATVKLAVKDLTLAEQIPGLCVGCAKPTTDTQQRHYLISFRNTVRLDVPYCAGCVAEHKAYERNNLYIALALVAAVLGIISAALVYGLLKLVPLALAFAALVPVGGVLILLCLMKRRKPKTGTGEVMDATEQRVTLVDVHDQFAAALEALRKRKAGGAAPKK
jgi:hypothetical protein